MSFSCMEWNYPSVDPDGMVTASEKGLTHCTKISPHNQSAGLGYWQVGIFGLGYWQVGIFDNP